MHAQAQPERPKGEGHGWPEFYSPQMRHRGHGDSGFSLSRLPAAQTPMPRPQSFMRMPSVGGPTGLDRRLANQSCQKSGNFRKFGSFFLYFVTHLIHF